MVYKWLINSLSVVMPQYCYLCGTPGWRLCPDCQTDLPRQGHACLRCGIALESELTPQICGGCLQSPPHFHSTHIPYAYQAPVSHMITALKFQRRLSLVPVLADSLAGEIERNATVVDALLPVPLHTSRLRQRGFNQALELARPLARRFGIPLMQQIERHRNTDAQSNLPAKTRQSNVRKAFRIKQPFNYQRVAIVDDVMTTGSTVNEIARLLTTAGVEEIQVWCVARA